MSANLEAKKQVVEEIKQKIQNSKSVVFVDYKGLTVAEVSALRNKFREAGVEYKVYKNTLVRKAFNELGVDAFDADLNGPTATAFSPDETSAAKIFAQAVKDLPEKIVPRALTSTTRMSMRRASKPSRICLRGKSSSPRCSARCRHPSPTLRAFFPQCCAA